MILITTRKPNKCI